MTSIAPAPPRANPFAPRIARLTTPPGIIDRRLEDAHNPTTLAGELLRRAVDRFEDARRLDELIRSRFARGPAWADDWETITAHAGSDVVQMEFALAYLIDALFNEVCPPEARITEDQEVEREWTAEGADRYIRRGVELDGVAYVLRHDVANMEAGIIARVASA